MATVESYRIAPGALSVPGAEGYLGSADVVQRLVGEFCAHAEAAFQSARAGTVVDLRPRVLEMADVFSGEHESHPPVAGWHGHSLPGKLRADLGAYMAEHGPGYGDDPVAVLFDWLGAHVVAAARAADGDDDLMAAQLRPSVQYAVRTLLGV